MRVSTTNSRAAVKTDFVYTNQWKLFPQFWFNIKFGEVENRKFKRLQKKKLCNQPWWLVRNLGEIYAERIRMINREDCIREFEELRNSSSYNGDLIKQYGHRKFCGNQTSLVSSTLAGDMEPKQKRCGTKCTKKFENSLARCIHFDEMDNEGDEFMSQIPEGDRSTEVVKTFEAEPHCSSTLGLNWKVDTDRVIVCRGTEQENGALSWEKSSRCR